MPVLLSLPLPRIPAGIGEYLPIRIPFPFWRIASILPQAVNEPMKASILALFKLAWSAKLQIPVLITVIFMACDIRLQLEINIFWETNNRHANHIQVGNNAVGQRRTSREDMRRAALAAAALYQQQRQRLIQEMRANQMNVRQLASQANQQRRESLQFPRNAPLATEEDSDLDDSNDEYDDEDESDDDTITCSQRSTTSEAGSFGSDGEDTEDADAEDDGNDQPARKKTRKMKRSRPSSRELDDENDSEDSTTEEEDDDDEEENGGGGGGMNGGSSHGGGSSGYRDDNYDPEYDDDGTGDSSQADSGSYGSPLVVEVEIRHRPLFSQDEVDENNDNHDNCWKVSLLKLSLKKPFHCFSFANDNNKSSAYNIFSLFRTSRTDYPKFREYKDVLFTFMPHRFSKGVL